MIITGLSGIKKALAEHREATAKGTRKGLIRAGLFLQRASQKVVPVDTGVLRASVATIPTGEGFNTEVTVGYGTDYAIYVHENLEARHKPGKTAKYLEGPLRDNEGKLREILTTAIREEL